MIIKLNKVTPQQRNLDQIIKILKNDGVIIYPTDTVYAFGCSILSKKAKDQIYRIKKLDPKDPLTFICSGIQQFEEYVVGITTPRFRAIKKSVPGRITFIFCASKQVPRVMQSQRSTIGVRIPDMNIPLALAENLGVPILSSSVPYDSEDMDSQNPEAIEEKYSKLVDCVVDGGVLQPKQSAIIDYSGEDYKIIREGDADLSFLS